VKHQFTFAEEHPPAFVIDLSDGDLPQYDRLFNGGDGPADIGDHLHHVIAGTEGFHLGGSRRKGNRLHVHGVGDDQSVVFQSSAEDIPDHGP